MKKITRAAIAVAMVGGLTLAGAAPSYAAELTRDSSSNPADCTTGYTDGGGMSQDDSIYNNTGQVLTLDPALTGHDGEDEHWRQQPPQTIAPNTCVAMSAYGDIFGDLTVHAVYTLPNGDYVPISVTNGDKDFSIYRNHQVFTSDPVPSQDISSAPEGSDGWSGTDASDHTISDVQSPNGTDHIHAAFEVN